MTCVARFEGDERAAPCSGPDGVVHPGRNVDGAARPERPAEHPTGTGQDDDVMVGGVMVPSEFGARLGLDELGGARDVGDRDGAGDDRVVAGVGIAPP
jgi:hypothetical protein